MTAPPGSHHRVGQTGSQRLFTFASGGWIVLLTLLVCAALVIWAVAPAILRRGIQPPGDGRTIDTYLFSLSHLNVERDLIVPAMLRRDMVPAITNPSASGPDPAAAPQERWTSMQRRNDPKYGKYLVPGDHVIGVIANGEARAYPLHVLYVHEVINDTLGGVPIAVTYHWPCASAVVFDRRLLSPAGTVASVAEFAISGLVYNSNLLMFDRGETQLDEDGRIAGGESLYAQLLARAITGPAAAREVRLRMLSYDLVSWGEWCDRHPQTTVLNRDLGHFERYKDAAPTQYFNSERLLFPVRPDPSHSHLSAKTRVISVELDAVRRVYPLHFIISRAMPAPADLPGIVEWHDTINGTSVRFTGNRSGTTPADWTVRVQAREQAGADEGRLKATHAFWFAWHAAYPTDQLVDPSAHPVESSSN